MGITLPPLPPSTYCGFHQRNRSLDSVLQKIPEIEPVEAPSASPSNQVLKPKLSFLFSDNSYLQLQPNSCGSGASIDAAVSGGRSSIIPDVVERCKDGFYRTGLGSDDSGICDAERNPREICGKKVYSNVDFLDAESLTSDCEVKSIYSDTLECESNMEDVTSEPEDISNGRQTKENDVCENEMEFLSSPENNTCLNSDMNSLSISNDERAETSETDCGVIDKPVTNLNESSSECQKNIVIDKGKENNEALNNSTLSQNVCVLTEKNNSDEKQSLLLRLFESKLFDMSMAVSYLFKCKEPGVQQYIGNRLFSLSKNDTYFYLPQLVNMYTQTFEVAEVLHPVLSHLCRCDTLFALHCAWLLDAYSVDTAHQRKKSHGTKFMNKILSDELR